MDKDFCKRVKKLLDERDIRLKYFLRDVNVGYDTYKSCERYGLVPRADDAVKIVEGLNVDIKYLLGDREDLGETDTIGLYSIMNRVSILTDILENEKAVQNKKLDEQIRWVEQEKVRLNNFFDSYKGQLDNLLADIQKSLKSV